MNGYLDERDFAQQIMTAAIDHADASGDIAALVEQAMDAGCGRSELIVALADLGARYYAMSGALPSVPAAQALTPQALEVSAFQAPLTPA
jgi:hypothetical protein